MFRYLLFWLGITSFSLTVVSGAYGDSPSGLTIVLQGGDFQGNFVRMLETLSERKLLPMETIEARAGETVIGIYRQKLGWPESLWSPKLQNIIQQISRENNLEKPLELGQIGSYPNIKVDHYIILSLPSGALG